MLHVNIIGQDSLAAATRECCARHFILDSSYPDILWVAYDTPIGKNDQPDSDWVVEQIRANLPPLGSDVLVLISSQMPVGSIARLEQAFPSYAFAYSPENIRVASAVADFENQARVVVGRRTERYDFLLSQLFAPFTKNLILTDPETAEMVKHTLNVWLAMNIAFINEIARLAVEVGADANVISMAMLSERRVSPKTPLRPGAPYGGGHLARDIYNLRKLGEASGVSIPIINHIKESNDVVPAVPAAPALV